MELLSLLYPSLYSLFLKKLIVLNAVRVLHFDHHPELVCVLVHRVERGLYLRDVK